MADWRKVIPESRDKLQSRLLVWCVGGILTLFSLLLLIRLIFLISGIGMPRRYHAYPHEIMFALLPWIVSLTFGLLVWAVRAATLGGVFSGCLICLLIASDRSPTPVWHTGLIPMIALFILTFTATRAGKRHKERLGVAEDRRGRNAAQVIANLGMAALIPILVLFYVITGESPVSLSLAPVLILAALCEATADTVSSEIGQAFGGTPILLTTLRRVPPGTDGAITLLGTAAGIASAALVALTGMWSMHLRWPETLIALSGGITGLLFDSLLGATIERKGWLGNDLVNFTSTAFAVLVALLLLKFAPR